MIPDTTDETDFHSYCEKLSDKQLAYVIRRNWNAYMNRGVKAHRTRFRIARAVGEGRGWHVRRGERL